MNCKKNVPTVKKKREVEMAVGDWVVEISRPIDCKKWSFIALFFIQRMAMVLKWVLISRPVARKRSLLYCFLFSILKMRCMYEINNQKAECGPFNDEKGAFCLNNAYYLIIWSVGSYSFTIAMPNPVVYYQKGRGKVSGYQQIAASACFIFSNLQ